MKRPKQLSASFVRSVTRPGRYGDGRGGFGLSLLVRETKSGRLSKTWAQRLRIHGKPVNVGLGSWPIVSLKEAREAVLENRRAIEQGRDPRGGGVPTFEQAAEKVIEIRRPSWRGPRSETQWRQSLQKHVFPLIGSTPVDQIDSAHILKVLGPVWFERPETARRLKQRLSAIMRWSIVAGYRTAADPVAGVTEALPKHNGEKRHFASLPHDQVGAALAKIRASGAWPATRHCLELQVLTAVRPSEARLAAWPEFDIEGRLWAIPPQRTKGAREFRVPLSSAAGAVLAEASKLSGPGGLVFASPISGKAISIATGSKLLRDLGIPAVAHGFRASFRSWAAEVGADREVAEAALAHTLPAIEASYQRSDLFERRRDLMESWARYVGGDDG
ncbi:tyrosine-type recombinase/integrase [Candidatus Palauibacter sp.]|uniref:tyrosine-type recombinase/integrase n=1 Tax=Candidatus Palauibacter sp. TaxID=3101350 RepID=UPI003AF2FFFA